MLAAVPSRKAANVATIRSTKHGADSKHSIRVSDQLSEIAGVIYSLRCIWVSCVQVLRVPGCPQMDDAAASQLAHHPAITQATSTHTNALQRVAVN